MEVSKAAHIEVVGNEVLGLHLTPGLKMEAESFDEGIRAHMIVEEGTVIERPVRICFGVLEEGGLQRIEMLVEIREGADISVFANCTFPNAKEVQHIMDAKLQIGKNARYKYFERHVHGPAGGVEVIPQAKIELAEGATFQTEFELIEGRAGKIDMNYFGVCEESSLLDMVARICGRADDDIKINEEAELVGEGATGVLRTNVAVKDEARARIDNKLVALAPLARGHVDCKEIVKDNAVASATPIVEVRHPRAHVTHEASIGSVDSKQLQTLMSRGLSEDYATELIIQGLLSRK